MRKALLGILAVLLLFGVIACGGDKGGGSKEIVIAVIPQDLVNPVFLPTKVAAERVGRELGIKIEWIASTRHEASEQVGIVEGLIERKVSGIAISCVTPEGLEEVLKRAIAAGIWVCTFDSDCPESGRSFYAGTANYEAGTICAQEMIKLYQGSSLPEIRVAQLEGLVGAFEMEGRKSGFADTIKGTNIRVIYSGPCDDDIDKSIEIIESYTRAHGNEFEAWFMAGGWPYVVNPDATPEVNAWRARSPNNKIVTMDIFPTSMEFFDRGLVDIAVGQNYDGMGDACVRGLYTLITEGQAAFDTKFADKITIEDGAVCIDSGVDLVNPSNYKEKIPLE
jgi:ribose transport system substrate-binding protein